MKKLFSLLLFCAPLLLRAQSVGISNDNSAPDPTAMLDIKSNSKGLLIPRMTTLERTSIMGPVIGLTVFDMTTFSYWVYRGDVNGGWAELQHHYQNYWTANGINIHNDNAGNVGIGTNNPGEKLTINSTNPVIQLMNSGTARGFLQVNNTDLRLSTYFNNTTGNLSLGTRANDRLLITPAGNIGIGTPTPSTLLTINGADPSLQLRNGESEKGFLQLAGDDIRIGTNATNTNGRFVIRTGNADRLYVNDNGWVGINTTGQNSMLQVNGDGTNAIFRAQLNGSTKLMLAPNGGVSIGANQLAPPANGLYVAGMTSIGTFNDPAAELTINNLVANGKAHIDFRDDNNKIGHIGTVQNAQVDIEVRNTSAPGRVILCTPNNPFAVMVHADDGVSVGGFQKATGYRLTVNGKIMCWDMTIEPNSNNWPDYVFEKNYRLMPLAEVRKFTATNKHLPNVPSAAQIDKTGIKVGDMTRSLLEKVEELTLYIFQLQDQIDQLKKAASH